MPFDRHRNFDCACGISRSGVRNRQNGNERTAIGFAVDDEYDDARPVFLSFFPSCPAIRGEGPMGVWMTYKVSP
jgi:hypothetical protein